MENVVVKISTDAPNIPAIVRVNGKNYRVKD